ncbi:MAG: hypothetical protein JXR91_07675 [Deltaproteobacteria bacterium]|nr:hypothetical protein [Deltaproteobacteria bacterium]
MFKRVLIIAIIAFSVFACGKNKSGSGDIDDYLESPPENPACYTPCKKSLITSDGEFIECQADGLMEACLDGKQCINGTCADVDDSEEYEALTCKSDIECPDFKRCIAGGCYSDCKQDGDCSGEKRCYRRTCRLPCSSNSDGAADNVCGRSEFCQTLDGEFGFCMPFDSNDDTDSKDVEEFSDTSDVSSDSGTDSDLNNSANPVFVSNSQFELSKKLVEFSNNHVSDGFKILNYAPTASSFTVRKVKHFEYPDSGAIMISENPLHWIKMGPTGDTTVEQEFTVLVDPASGDTPGEKTIDLKSAYNETLLKWEGEIEVVNEKMGVRKLSLSYRTTPDGQWSGRIYNFAQFRDVELDKWVLDKGNKTKLEKVENAFIKRWSAFKDGLISYDEFKAVLLATRTESWKLSSVKDMCKNEGGADVACYLYQNSNGYSVYTTDQKDFPIPSAVSELDMVMNLKVDDTISTRLTGRIESSEAPQYAGDPAVNLEFLSDPTGGCDSDRCFVPIKSFNSTIRVGGRHALKKGSCANEGFADVEVPWLVPGFADGTFEDDVTGERYYSECREMTLPFGTEYQDLYMQNPILAGSNPIPDGQVRERTLELVDGALIDQKSLFIIYREHFPSFLGSTDTEGFSSYGFMVLERSPEELAPEDFVGFKQDAPASVVPDDLLNVGCSEDFLASIGVGSVTSGNVDTVVNMVLDGVAGDSTAEELDSTEIVHYYCEDTGLFDGGRYDDDVNNLKEPCPAGSKVIFFTLSDNSDVDFAPLSLAGQECNNSFSRDANEKIVSRGTCQKTLNSWINNEWYSIRLDPLWRCTDPNEVYCESDRLDLRSERTFYQDIPGAPTFLPLRVDVANAFRYKTRFRTRDGQSIGFVPEICVKNSDAVPYCYSPETIENLYERVNCATSLYSNNRQDMSDEVKARLLAYLKENFMQDSYMDYDTGNTIVQDGFEFLNAELLIMLGDDAYTESFAARLDLAGSNMTSFKGSLFEVDGMDLSGGAGYEMVSLYRSIQYYQKVLDRFYNLSPMIWKAIEIGAPNSFITQQTVVTYFDRLVRASSQKARAWSEVAKRYQNFNRADLAYPVIERAYASAYLESIVMSRMMLKMLDEVAVEKRDQIVMLLETSGLIYKAALLEMKDVHSSINEDINYFGYSPDYIPFPALDDNDTNSFEKQFAFARQRLEMARQKEDAALADSRSFDVDSASFQSELIKLSDSYENQLGDLCGTFEGFDGNIYPAIPEYAHMSERTSWFNGSPCGFVGNGQIHDAMASMEITAVDLKSTVMAQENIFKKMEIEKDRTVEQCNVRTEINELIKARLDVAMADKKADLDDIFTRRNAAVDDFKAKIDEKYATKLEDEKKSRQSTADAINTLTERKQGKIADVQYDSMETNASLNDDIRNTEVEMNRVQRTYDNVVGITSAARCSDIATCIQAGAAVATMSIATGVKGRKLKRSEDSITEKQTAIALNERDSQKEISTLNLDLEIKTNKKQTTLELDILGQDAALDAELRRIDNKKYHKLEDLDNELQDKLASIENNLDKYLRDKDVKLNCDLADVDMKASIANLILSMHENELQILKADYSLKLAMSQIAKLFNQSTRVLAEMSSHEQLLINVEAAKNNPNIRIYKNDAIINADRTFNNALKEAYKATKLYEYYTSQTYAKSIELFLIRMVGAGDYSLEEYLDELEDSFHDFEEEYGNPDTRVAVLSLRDDILSIPYMGDSGEAVSQTDRIDAFRDAIRDVRLIDSHGYINIPFSTVLSQLSPLTRNHKIEHVEVEIIGTDIGDTVGRVYLRQNGTGVMNGLDGETSYFAFPERLAVINPLFNGNRVFEPDVYKNRRLRDRPFINTNWEFIFNQKDESVNEDIVVDSLTDIRLYVYYTDFTQMYN